MSDSDTSNRKLAKFSKKSVPTSKLIAMVRERRSLWDRMFPAYKDKLLKDKAWHEIYQAFEPNFDSLNQARKNFVGSTITRKWHNARDSYVKSRKAGARSKPYVYSEELRFLDETLMLRKSRKSNSFMNEECDETEQDASQTWMNEVFVNIEEERGDENSIETKRPRIEYEETFQESSKETPKEECEENIVSVLVNLIQKEEDEDRAFFKSITPAVKTLSERSKFEFRIQVMKFINTLKLRDKNGVILKREKPTSNDDESDSA